MTVNVDNYLLCCRMCLELDKNELFLNIFSTTLEESDVSLQLALEKTTGIKCSTDDELPAQICQSCQLRLQDAHNFMAQGCVNNDLLESLKLAASLRNDALEETPEQTTPIKRDPEAEGEVEYLGEEGEFVDEEILDNSIQLNESVENLEETTETSSQIVFEINEPTDAVDFILQNFQDMAKHPPKPRQPATFSQRHQCEVCNKSFQRKSNLVDHLRLHANVKMFSCELCDASFVQSGNLKSHIRIHTKEKPYTCSECGRGFSQSSALKTHMRSHTNTRDYICEICKKGFTNKSDLSKHKITHTDLRYYYCIRCQGRFFAQKVHLRKHIKSHHSEEDESELLKRGTLKEGVHIGEMKPESTGSIFIRTKPTPNS